MDDNKSMAWILGGIVVVIILVVLGYFALKNGAPAGTGTQATSTPEGATTTSAGTGSAVARELRTTSSVSAVVAGLPNSARFNALLASSGVSLAGKGPFTVFVPTDGAFTRLPPGELSAMSAAALKRLVQYHIVSGKMLDVDAVSSGTWPALSKDKINFLVKLSDGTVYVNSGVVVRQYKASNGIVYVINSVLVPPTASSTTPIPR